MQPKNAIKLNYEGGLGIETKYKSAGPHMHEWLTAGPVRGFWSWDVYQEADFGQWVLYATYHSVIYRAAVTTTSINKTEFFTGQTSRTKRNIWF